MKENMSVDFKVIFLWILFERVYLFFVLLKNKKNRGFDPTSEQCIRFRKSVSS